LKVIYKTTPSVIIRLLIWAVLIIGGAYISIKTDLKYFKSLFFSPVFHIITFFLGVFILKLSFHAASVGGKELAKKGREGNIPRLETNKLVTTGIYSCTRHPMMFGLMLLPLGIALLLGSVTFIFISILEAVLIFVLMVVFDEKEAVKKFGKDYLAYKKTTPIFPKEKECWKRLFFK
jgi:protein-S-isoprenylcysteine O-methyltransferase Ste14